MTGAATVPDAKLAKQATFGLRANGEMDAQQLPSKLKSPVKGFD